MSVQGNHFQFIFIDLKQFAGHQLVVVIVRNGKDRLADHFF